MILLAAVWVGCTDKSTPDFVARAFVDAYFLEFDLDRALVMADGPAAERIRADKKLVDDARKRFALNAARSRVYYEAPEVRKVRDDLVYFTFLLEADTGSGEMLERRVLINVAKPTDLWRVISFREVGPPGMPMPDRPGAEDRVGVGPKTRSTTVAAP